MNSSTDTGQPTARLNRRRLALIAVSLPVLFALLLFVPAGTWTWGKGYLFMLVFSVSVVAIFSYLWRVNPEVVIARSHSHEGAKRWDRILVSFFFFPAVWAILPVAALDDGRFHWFPVPLWVCGIGYALLLAGMGIATWAESVNKFFELNVRIQTERGHIVIDTGPYAIVRHPGYVGGILTAAGMALSLGSLWALIPAGVGSLVLVIRTQWEDQTLQQELDGYREYTQRVRSRLIPGIW